MCVTRLIKYKVRQPDNQHTYKEIISRTLEPSYTLCKSMCPPPVLDFNVLIIFTFDGFNYSTFLFSLDFQFYN